MFTGMPEGRARSDGARARAALAGGRFADVRWVAETGSTNSDALALARDGAPEGIVVVADHQSAGRGRRSRTWVAPPGGSLLLSLLLRPPVAVAGAVTMATAVALAEAVERVAGVRPGLKWPNDLVVGPDDRKLAGILAEADWPAGSTISGGYRPPDPHERAVVVVGVGINVVWPDPVLLGAEVAEVATTAAALNWVGPAVERVGLLVAFLRRLDARYTALLAEGPTGTLDAWRARSVTLGRRVRIDLGADDIEGTALDVTGDGYLVVETSAGERRTLAVGEVVHLRAR